MERVFEAFTRALVSHTQRYRILDSCRFKRCTLKIVLANNCNKASIMAVRDWLDGFLRRNSLLFVRKNEETSMERIKGFNREEVPMFFNKIEDVMSRYKFSH
ncbi:hypothetical protein PR048_009135 [Dryococelus australis]|uniref:Uncharacterized protein n=1 Tax=Dryococelus australis TaxID=614101 RepID=A0ABQ9HZ25_9NEOP|nr:hypothetical protein PR048_009135 [Dryococelus australis]